MTDLAIPKDIEDLLFEIFDPEGAVLWWLSRNRTLELQRPCDLARTPDGHQRVVNLLNRLADGNL